MPFGSFFGALAGLDWCRAAESAFTLAAVAFACWHRPKTMVAPPAMRRPGVIRPSTACPGAWPERKLYAMVRPWRVDTVERWIDTRKHRHNLNKLPCDDDGVPCVPTMAEMVQEELEFDKLVQEMVEEGIIAKAKIPCYPLLVLQNQFLCTFGRQAYLEVWTSPIKYYKRRGWEAFVRRYGRRRV